MSFSFSANLREVFKVYLKSYFRSCSVANLTCPECTSVSWRVEVLSKLLVVFLKNGLAYLNLAVITDYEVLPIEWDPGRLEVACYFLLLGIYHIGQEIFSDNFAP